MEGILQRAQNIKEVIGDRIWSETIDNINKHIKQIIKNKELFIKVFGDDTKEIELEIFNNAVDAYVDLSSKGIYKIGISEEIIALLYEHSKYIFKSNNFFKEIQEKNEREKARSSLFYYWIEIIFLHEVAHFFRGHLEEMGVDKFFEFKMFKSQEMESDIFFYEIDADRYGGIFYATIFFLSIPNLKNHLKINEKLLIERYLIEGTLLFFDYFNNLDKKINDVSYIDHSHPLQRMIFVLTAIQEAKNMKNELFDEYLLEEFEELVNQKHIQFITHMYKEQDIQKVYQEIIDKKYFEKYDKFLKNKGLK